MNKVILIGRLTRDPELRYTGNNTPVATFSLAVNRNHVNSEGEREADFINIVVWKKQAENVKNYLFKGSQCAVDGSIQNRSYDDNNGNKKYITEVIANRIEFLDTKKKGEMEDNDEWDIIKESNPFEEFGQQISINPDELPFN